MVENPLISVLMAAYREPLDQFRQAVESILNQTYGNFELILVADNPDNTELISLAKQYAQQDKRINLVLNESNIGLAQSLNKAIDIAQGDFLCRMDSDDVSLSDRLEKQLRFLEEHDYDLIGGQVAVIDSDGTLLYNTGAIPSESASVNKCLRFNNSVPHPTWFGRREVFVKRYRNIDYCEDYDFLVRSALQGERLGNLKEIVLMYRMSKSSISRDNLYRQFLSQLYLTAEYKDGRSVSVDAMRKWINSRFDGNKACKYEKANSTFNTAMRGFAQGAKLKSVASLVKIPFISYDYMRKIYRIMRVKLTIRA